MVASRVLGNSWIFSSSSCSIVLGRAHGSPFALAEVGPAVVAQADDVDLGGLGPVPADFEGGGDPFL
jgi:hypothetical protein